MQSKSYQCCICCEIFKDPVECTSCHNNFCKAHIPQLKNCPLCRKPLNYKDNVWLKRELENIKFCKCSICNFEGDNNLFFLHLMEKHKTELIKKFNVLSNEQEKNENNNQSISGRQNSKITFDYGVYTGEVKNGVPDGRGKLDYSGIYKGDRYEGDFRNGVPNGKGIYYHSNGNIYEGSFRNDKANGKGIFYFNNGNRYEGDFVDDGKEGKGIYYYANGDRMMGNYHNDKPIGNHAVLHSDGNISLKQFS